MRRLKQFKFTLMFAFIAIVAYLAALLFDWDFFEQSKRLLDSLENWEGDEILLAALLIFFGLSIDFFIRYWTGKKLIELNEARVETLENTMRKVHHIVNNSLNKLSFIQFQWENEEVISEEDLKLFEIIINETAKAIKNINELDDLKITFEQSQTKPAADK